MSPSSDVRIEEFVCDCLPSARTACESLPFFRQVEDKRYCALHCPTTEKQAQFAAVIEEKLAQRDYNFCGAWFPADVDFTGCEFPTDARFTGATFTGDALFAEATFREAADFTGASFRGTAYFSGAIFSAAHFSHASFDGVVDFIKSTFQAGAIFVSAIFRSDIDFTSALFKESGNFTATIFEKSVLFVGTTHGRKSTLSFLAARFRDAVAFRQFIAYGALPFDFHTAIFEHPDRVTFQTVAARAFWFIHTDPRKFHFVDVTWLEGTQGVRPYRYSRTLDSAMKEEQLLSVAYRRLAANAEENGRYAEAASFRYEAMRMRTRELRRTFWRSVSLVAPVLSKRLLRARVRIVRPIARRFHSARSAFRTRATWKHLSDAVHAIDPLHRLYGVSSGYGERAGQALIVLAAIWIIFAAAYRTGDMSWWQPRAALPAAQRSATQPDNRTYPITIGDALIYSAGVLTLQKPEPAPRSRIARVLVLLETILGPLQAALFALAVRRKFMRM